MSVLDRGSRVEEVQSRNGQDHQRTLDPETHILLTQILKELQKMNQQLEFITDEEDL
jgi:hypothetical protein